LLELDPIAIGVADSTIPKLYITGELVGKSAFDIIHPDDKIKILPILKQYVKMIMGGVSKEKAKTMQERIECRFPDK